MDTGFMSPNKFVRAQQVSDFLRSHGIPSPRILRVRMDEPLRRTWCLQEIAKGKQADEIVGTESERPALYSQLAVLMARLHRIPSPSHDGLTAHGWYLSRMHRAVCWLTGRLINRANARRILTAAGKLLQRVSDGPTSIIHGDLMSHNVFVSPYRQGGTTVMGLIDWESCQWQADPRSEAVLTAWWAAGEHTGDAVLFRLILELYNDNDPPSPIRFHELDALVMLADLTWYVTILPFTSLFEKERLNSRLTSVLNILDRLESQRPYLPAGW